MKKTVTKKKIHMNYMFNYQLQVFNVVETYLQYTYTTVVFNMYSFSVHSKLSMCTNITEL